jgi:hypothetical protein
MALLRCVCKLVKSILGHCNCCGRYFMYPERRRLNTAYVNEESNWLTSCQECYDEACDHYAELWNDYYGGLL